MKVLFYHSECRTQEPAQHSPYGILQLAAITDQLGYKVRIFDNNVYRYPIDAVRQGLHEEAGAFDIIGITGLITQFKFIQTVAKVIREEFPAALIVGGGGWISSMPFEMMKWVPEIDIGAIGEAYNTWRDIQEHFDDKNWGKVKGLIYREGKKVKLSPMRPLIAEEKLDEEIPWPAYEFSPVDNYLKYSPIAYSVESSGMVPLNTGEGLRRLDVCSSYGCSWGCKFCYHVAGSPAQQSSLYCKKITGKPFRQHSPKYVVGLIDHLRRQFAINFVSFIDENFTTNKAWFYKFCETLEEADLAKLIKWGVVGHARTVDKEMLAKGHDTGLSYISYGGESASKRILDSIGKGQSPEQMTAAIEATHTAQVNPIMSFIVGFPNEDIDDVIATAQFFIDNQIHCDPFYLQPYPATAYYDEYKDKIIEQHMTEEEKKFLGKPEVESYIHWLECGRAVVGQNGLREHPSITQLRKEFPLIQAEIRDLALKRWILSLDDATKMSCNLTEFTDVELAGLKYMLASWDVERLKKFKKQLAERKSKFEELKSWKRIE